MVLALVLPHRNVARMLGLASVLNSEGCSSHLPALRKQDSFAQRIGIKK